MFNYLKNNEFLTIILLIGIFLRLYQIDFQSAWVDELHTMNECNPNHSFRQFWDSVVFREGMSHLYFYLGRLISIVFYQDIVLIRFLSAAFGILSIFYIYKLGDKLVNKNVGLLSALFLSLNMFHIEYSQEGRSYSMLLFFAIIAFYQLLFFLEKKTLLSAILLGIFCGLITNAHPIGILNVVSVYLIIAIQFIISKEDRLKLLKQTIVSGIVTLIVFLPILPTLLNVNKLKSFWITDASVGYIYQTLLELFGNSFFLASLFLVAYFYFLVAFLKTLKNADSAKAVDKNKMKLSFIVLNVWLFFEVVVIIVKSYLGVSIILHRYFIAIVPVFMIIIAIAIDFLKNAFYKRLVIYGIVISMVINLFFISDYYSTRTKSQFDLVAKYIIQNNTSREKIVSNWGWLMENYFNKTNGLFTQEKDLNLYIDDIRNGAQNQSSFWYIDGNSRPMKLTNENQNYVEENYILKNKFEAFDAWCIEFKSKKTDDVFIELRRFKPSLFDGSGALIFVENKKYYYPKIDLEKGEYIFSLKGQSLPEKPINGENAHFNMFINGNKIKDFNLSNIPNQLIEIPYIHNGGEFRLFLQFDNDIFVDNQDRNAIINSIVLKKKE